MRYLTIILLSWVSLLTSDAKEITGPAMPDLNSPAISIKSLCEKIAAEPENPESIIYVNYLATYLVLLAEKKEFPAEAFITLNRVAPVIAKLRVGAPIIIDGNIGWKKRIIEDPFDAIAHRPFLSFYIYHFFEEAKKMKERNIPEYTGPVYGTL